MDPKFTPPSASVISGHNLEKIVLHKSKKLFKQKSNRLNSQLSQSSSCCKNPIYWWSPSPDNLSAEFCQETSIHGLKFCATGKNRHLAERVFWVIAFCSGFIAAVLLINDVWSRYYENPVIVTFEPKEQDIDGLSFPCKTVTICNINKFPKSKVEEILKIAKETDEKDPEGLQSRKQLRFIRNVCTAQKSFSKEFGFAASRGVINFDFKTEAISEEEQEEMMDFLMNFTTPCHDMIRLCMFAEKKINCTELFSPLITDYGKCCTFNILPYPLLMKDPRINVTIHTAQDGKILGDEIWSQNEIDLWQLWDYTNAELPKQLKRPYTQQRAGLPYGLSILLDSNLDQYFCPAADSNGYRFAIHTPLEMPHIAEFSNVLDLNKEVYVEVTPNVFNADDNVKEYDHSSRKCYFQKEFDLSFFRPYTATNCIDECTAKVIMQNCSCSYFYMPRPDGTKVCNTNENSKDGKCILSTKVALLKTLQAVCGHCDRLCENFDYTFEMTVAELQNPAKIWTDVNANLTTVPEWANNKLSIVHIYFGSDSIVPRLRKQLYGPTDLIASTGGLLGLCLGVSVLSIIEAVYSFTMRVCFKTFGEQNNNNKAILLKFINIFTSRNKSNSINSITLNPKSIPVYDHDSKYPKYPTIPVLYDHQHQQ